MRCEFQSAGAGVSAGELWVSKQQVHIVLEALKSAGAKGTWLGSNYVTRLF